MRHARLAPFRVAALVLAPVFILAGSLPAQPPPLNVRLNNDETPYLQNEEQIWINWTDPLNVIANWRDWRLGYRRIGVAVSTNGGATWGTDSLVVGIYDRQSDPCLTGDRAGNFYFNMLDYEATGTASTISVLRSTDGGLTWGSPVAATPLGPWFEDKQFTTADRTGGLYDGNYYCSWTRFPNTGPSVIMFVRSTDGAQTFRTPIVVGPVILSSCGTYGAGQASIPVVNVDGTVHVFWSGYDIDSSCTIPLYQSYAIRRTTSVNGGATFGLDSVAFPSNAYFELVDGGVDVYGFPIADADLSGGAYHGNLYIAHTQYVSGYYGETDVEVRRSTDNGITWSDPTIVHDDLPGQNIDQFHPWLTVNQQGVVLMIFYDQRTDPVSHYRFDCFFTASFDGAETFIHNWRLSEVSIDPANLAAAAAAAGTTPTAGGPDPAVALAPQAGAIAEYIGVHANYDHVAAVWTDTRNGNQDVYGAQFELPFQPPRLYLPADGTVTPEAQPAFRWSTCWHQTQDSYRLELSLDPGFGSPEYVWAGLTENDFQPPEPLASGIYYWRVKAFRTGGDSTAYSEVFTLNAACTAGAPPALLSPAADDTLDVAEALLIWEAVPDAVSYDVQVSALSDFSVLHLDSSLAGTEVEVSDLSDSTTYFWRVRSWNPCAGGDWAESSFRVEVCPVLLTGDVNLDGILTSSDIIWLVNFVFKSGPEPQPVPEAGDVNCDGVVTAADVVYLVSHMFRSGPAPCDVCTLL